MKKLLVLIMLMSLTLFACQKNEKANGSETEVNSQEVAEENKNHLELLVDEDVNLDEFFAKTYEGAQSFITVENENDRK